MKGILHYVTKKFECIFHETNPEGKLYPHVLVVHTPGKKEIWLPHSLHVFLFFMWADIIYPAEPTTICTQALLGMAGMVKLGLVTFSRGSWCEVNDPDIYLLYYPKTQISHSPPLQYWYCWIGLSQKLAAFNRNCQNCSSPKTLDYQFT